MTKRKKSKPRRAVPETLWLVECGRCGKPKAPRGQVPVKSAEAKNFCMRDCPGYEEWPQPSTLPSAQTEGAS